MLQETDEDEVWPTSICQVNMQMSLLHLIQSRFKVQFLILMFVPCIIRRSKNKQHHARNCTTALFYILALICFGSSLPSSRSFWIRLSYVKIQIDLVVYHIMLVKWSGCRSVVVPHVVLPSAAGKHIQKLLDDGRLLPKHVTASISNIAVVQICA
jgi:hypothetical protein